MCPCTWLVLLRETEPPNKVRLPKTCPLMNVLLLKAVTFPCSSPWMITDPPNEVTLPHATSPFPITIFSLNDGLWVFLVHVKSLPFTLLSVACAEGNVHARCSPIPLIFKPRPSNDTTSTSKSQ